MLKKVKMMKIRAGFGILLISCLFLCCSRTTNSEFIYYESLEDGISEARKNQSEILLWFDLSATSNRGFESKLRDLKVENRFTIVRLFVDDLTMAEDGLGNSIGTNNRLFQQSLGSDYQPALYVMNFKEEILKGPMGYAKIDSLHYILFK